MAAPFSLGTHLPGLRCTAPQPLG